MFVTRDLQKRLTKRDMHIKKETYKRDLQKRPRKESCKRELRKRPTKETYKRELQERPAKKTYTRDQEKRPIGCPIIAGHFPQKAL